ncbi:MAG: aspartate aminotransferase family protein [Gemmatimonadetes bacterium]|nr:aspartate aminotransferase family protein [Gemmatimonadota bacterium]MYD26523.1 aspartate aminotransferase family protein [Gemmatimonadota bacterium]
MSQSALIERAERVFVGGGNGEFRLPPEANLVVTRGEGATIHDTAGKTYIDFLLGSGPMILGHAHPEVVEAVTRQVARGTTFMALNEPAIELAERVADASPCGEKVRLVITGSESMQFALRAARAFTGRDRCLRFEGGWHGVSDAALHGARTLHPGAYPGTLPDGGGIPRSWSADMLAVPFNDVERATEVVERHHGELAAIVIEPLQRCILPRPGFFEAIRALCDRYGIVLIFDEIVTGFRMAWGGAQERYGVTADLAAYGKTISGGYPLAAMCGRTDVMDVMNGWRPADDPKRVIASGTFNGYPVGAVAGLATLDVLGRPGTYERLFAMGDRITREITAIGARHSIPLLVGGEGPVLQVLFTGEREIVDYGSMFRADKEKAFVFGVEMIKRGLFVSPYEKIYLSLVHTDDHIDRLLESAEEVLRDVIAKMD